MSRIISGTYTSTQFLSNPVTDNPATVMTVGIVQVADADGIFGAASYPWTLTNLGTVGVLGTAGDGVHLAAGGTVTNGRIGSAGISITAPAAGVEINGAAGTVNNFGRISGPTANGVGVLLELGGSVTNGAIGAGVPLISGAYNGIFVATGAASIINFGEIEAPGAIFNGGRAANVAVFLGAGGIVQNGTDGSTAARIEGYHMGVFSGPLGSPVTISNFGTIVATGTHCNDAAGASGPEAGVGILLGAPDPVIRNGSSSTTSALIQGYYRGIGAGYYGTATVVNFGTIESTQTGLPVRYFGVAIVLHNGGSITNYGLIKGAQNGVWTSVGETSGAPGTIDNFGTIEATGGFAVLNGHDLLPSAVALFNGGTITNDGLIRSGGNGVVLTNTAGTVVNTGTIQSTAITPGPTGVPAAGVILASGGGVINGANGATGALIQAYQTGVYVGGLGGNSTPGAGTITNHGTIAGIGSTAANGVVLIAGGTVSNSGTIVGSGRGIVLSDGGIVTNGSPGTTGARISGGIGIQTTGRAGATVTSYGTIIGSNGIAVSFGGSGANLLALGGGYQLTGTVQGSTAAGATNTLELLGTVGSAVTVDYNGISLTNFENVLFGTGGNATLLVSNASGTLGVTISGFDATSEFIDLIGIGADGAITNSDTSTDRITVTGSLGSMTLQFDEIDGLNFMTIGDGSSGTEVAIACYCRGTLILTDHGEVPVEELAVGDRVRVLSGGCKPIVWIGFGRDLVRRANRLARPIVVRRGALAHELPRRDLYLTHGHALYLEGVLIPVEHLVNHRSIAWDETARIVEYYHIEVEDHDVLFAEGALAESYYNAGNRASFQNTREGSVAGGVKPTCAPVLNRGEVVETVWAALFERAGGQLEFHTTDDADLHLVLDGERINPTAIEGSVYCFAVKRPPARNLRLRSRSGVPSLLGLGRQDHRRLGVAIKQIILHHADLPTCFEYDAPQFREGGCHPNETGYCWTDGEFELPARFFTLLNEGFTLVVHTEPHYDMRYPIPSRIARAA